MRCEWLKGGATQHYAPCLQQPIGIRLSLLVVLGTAEYAVCVQCTATDVSV